MKSPPPCPATVTIRRNPPRKARATPSSAIPLRQPLSSPSLSRDIFSTELPQNPNITDNLKVLAENLKVYLRIRPLAVQKSSKNTVGLKNAWPKNPKTKSNCRPKTKKSSELCVQVNEDLRSVTVSTPQPLQETKRIKSEVYEGFSHVFGSEASQSDLYEEMVKPLVEDFLKGKSGMLAAMGPSGSGKTHTVFGCAREPGMVPLALRRIFGENKSSGTGLSSRVFYLSMFEISSEKGKAERMIDLLQDGGDICMQHSVLKGLQEAVVCDAQQAESLIAHGMLKRATAMTNSNSQSSRSQCIINIRCDSEKDDEEVDGKASSSMLTIVDLAGAEREKKTGNQGARLLESNFINNTSMVFGLCLRSLLEHQKNRNKPLQKHYQNSLISERLSGRQEEDDVVKPGVEDYLDTSFLLRQASPFTKIKFKNLDDPVNLTSNKRLNQALPRAEQLKKMKFSGSEAFSIDDGNTDTEVAKKVVKDCLNQTIEDISDENLDEVHVLSDGFVGLGIQEKSLPRADYSKIKAEKDREYQIMQGFSKALWTVLKQYREKLKGVESENCHLRDSLTNEKARSLDLENELTSKKKTLFDLENELQELKSRCTCENVSAVTIPVSLHDASFNLSQYQMAELLEDLQVNSEVSSYSSKQLEQTENEEETEPSVRDSIVTSSSCSGEDVGLEDKLSLSEATSQLTSACLYTSHKSDAVNSRGDVKNLEPESDCVSKGSCDATSRECESAKSSAQLENGETDDSTSQLASACLYTSHKSDAVNIRGVVKNLESESDCVSVGSCPATSRECESAKTSQDYEDLEDAKGEATQLENGATDDYGLSLVEDQIVSVAADSHTNVSSSEFPWKDDVSFHVDEERLNNEAQKRLSRKSQSFGLTSLLPEISWCIVVDMIKCSFDLSLNEFWSPLLLILGVSSIESSAVDPLVTVLPKDGRDAENVARFVPKQASCNNFQHTVKPKRRLLPASSVLLKDINILDIKDENDKPKAYVGTSVL
ncbi:hypothetical protein DH2020_007462 [Rehmannia glutinosa]|uniref:Kinesin-like protein n=1 Tax=Rehmannia glutinosa TaxID=99300 RepID=A0ABR0TY81_REHGL